MIPSSTPVTRAPLPPRPPEEALRGFVARVAAELGGEVISTDAGDLVKLSSDWSRMSPVLQEKLPPGRFTADVVVAPATSAQIPAVLAAAHEFGVPITPRGAGTGNYGQATPFAGGAVLDLRRCDRVLEVGDGWVRVEAGAKLTDVDAAVRATGQDLWIFPSTKGSTAGGFVAGGSAGTGTIEHGTTADGFVREVVVAPCDGSGSTLRVAGEQALAHVHAYGVTGVLTELVLATEPAREWSALYVAADDFETGVAVLAGLRDLGPRLASMDEPPLVENLPTPHVERGAFSVRAILADTVLDAARELVDRCAARVSAVVPGVAATDLLSGMSYNHPVYFLQQAGYPCFHLEVGGDPLWHEPDVVRAQLPNVLLHLEVGYRGIQGMLVADYVDEEQVLAGIERLQAVGVGVHSPHQWYVDRHLPQIRAVVADVDPRGLLNPGKLTAEDA